MKSKIVKLSQSSGTTHCPSSRKFDTDSDIDKGEETSTSVKYL